VEENGKNVMVKLTEITKARRVDQALQVLALLSQNSKMTQEKACAQVGMDPQAYRYWITQSHEAIQAFQDTIHEVERLEMANILMSKEQILQKLLTDALAKYTDPLARLAILQYLDDRIDNLADRHRATNIDGVDGILGGPDLAPGQNRFGHMNEDLVITDNVDGSINIKAKAPIIIDASAISQEETNEGGRSDNSDR
jgi:GGDEF domain-containing protein